MSPQMEEKIFWFQDAAFDILSRGIRPRKRFAVALVTYRAICAIGGESNSEVSPHSDGKPFPVKITRIASMISQPSDAVAKMLRVFVKLGLIECELPSDWLAPFAVRIVRLGRVSK